MSQLLFTSLLALSLGSLLCLPLISVNEIGRGFFTLWVATVGVLGAIALGLDMAGLAGPGAQAAGERMTLLLALTLALLAAFWAALRLGAMRSATVLLIASALCGALVLREQAVAPALGLTGAPRQAKAQGNAADPAQSPASSAGSAQKSPPSADSAQKSPASTDSTQSSPALAGEDAALGSAVIPALSPQEAALRVTSLLLSALAVGMVTVAMVLGHWYLVQLKLAIAPLRRLCDIFVGLLLVRLAVSVWGVVASVGQGYRFFGGDEPIPWEALILSQRVLFGFGGSLILAVMIRKTVALRSTMSATGLLYIAILFVWVGEFLSIYLCNVTHGNLVV